MTLDQKIDVHGRPTSLRWLISRYFLKMKWFGPMDTRVDTGLPCAASGCNGRLIHVYECVEIEGEQHKVVFTKTNNNNRRVATKCHDSCTLPSCPNWGEWVLVSVRKDEKLAKAYKKQTRSWRYKS